MSRKHFRILGEWDETFKLQSMVLIAIAFVLGCSEYIIVGILDNLAKQFQIGISQVGYLVTGFALVYAISTPLITLAIGKKVFIRLF